MSGDDALKRRIWELEAEVQQLRAKVQKHEEDDWSCDGCDDPASERCGKCNRLACVDCDLCYCDPPKCPACMDWQCRDCGSKVCTVCEPLSKCECPGSPHDVCPICDSHCENKDCGVNVRSRYACAICIPIFIAS